MRPLPHVLSRFVKTPLMIDPTKLDVIIKAMESRLFINTEEINFASNDENTPALRAGFEAEVDDSYYSVVEGIAVVPVQGTLMKRLSGIQALSGGCTYLSLQNQLQSAVDDSQVNGILLNIDSPGGETSGCFELADFIYSLRGSKPIYAVANDCAASAAYAIASPADKIFVTQVGGVGSVGVYALHLDQSSYDKETGVKYTYVFAGNHKVDGNPHEPLSEYAKSDIQAEVDREYDMFTSAVAKYRRADLKEIIGTQARMFWGENALPLLADKVGTFDDAFAALSAKINKSKSSYTIKNIRSENPMADTLALVPDTNTSAAAVLLNATSSSDEEMKNKGDKPDDKDKDGKDKKKADDPEECKDDMKKAAALSSGVATLTPGIAYEFKGRSEEDISTIKNLCSMAGVPATETLDFLSKKNDKGNLMSVEEISASLIASRAAESEKRTVNSNIGSEAGSKVTISQLEAQAKVFAATNRTVTTNCLYREGPRKGTTPEQAYAQALENNPQAYEDFRNQHNANALVGTLRKAGFKIVSE